jgi:hypothetical protein
MTREREIVRLVAAKTRLNAVRLWLWEDERGSWERTAHGAEFDIWLDTISSAMIG